MAGYSSLHFAPGPAADELKALLHQAASARRGTVDRAADWLGIKPNTLNAQITTRTMGLPWLSALAMVHYANYPLLNKWYLFPDTRWVNEDPLTPPTDNFEKEVVADPVMVLSELAACFRKAMEDNRLDALESQRLSDLYDELERQIAEGRALLRRKGARL